MKPCNKFKPNFFDLIPASAVAALAVFCAVTFWGNLQRAQVSTLTVSFDGETVLEISLDEAGTDETLPLTHNGVTMTLTLNPGGETGAQVTSSNCPGGDCVRTGAIHRSGESIVCLPGRTVISLSGGHADGVDAVIG